MKKLGIVLGSGWTYENDDVEFIPRTHLYEGLGVDAVADPIRRAKQKGVERIIITNAAGSLRHQPGTICLISDHINLTGVSPITGKEFIDMTDTYSKSLRQSVQNAHKLPEAVYAQFRGPQYETPAEVKMAGILGADLVGMSSALEAITARQLGMEIIGLSLVTNYAAGIGQARLDHSEVLAIAEMARFHMRDVLDKVVTALK
jgi:purine-nucleoside phosphorylase